MWQKCWCHNKVSFWQLHQLHCTNDWNWGGHLDTYLMHSIGFGIYQWTSELSVISLQAFKTELSVIFFCIYISTSHIFWYLVHHVLTQRLFSWYIYHSIPQISVIISAQPMANCSGFVLLYQKRIAQAKLKLAATKPLWKWWSKLAVHNLSPVAFSGTEWQQTHQGQHAVPKEGQS